MTMSTVRFSLVAIGLFALAFIGISWASKGFPVMVMRTVPLKPDARLPTFEESVKQGLRKDWENSKTAQSDGNKEHDALRLELLQASTGYNQSPCDPTMKKNLVEALTRYVSAWATMAGCKSGICTGSDKQLDAAAAAVQDAGRRQRPRGAARRAQQGRHRQGRLPEDDPQPRLHLQRHAVPVR